MRFGTTMGFFALTLSAAAAQQMSNREQEYLNSCARARHGQPRLAASSSARNRTDLESGEHQSDRRLGSRSGADGRQLSFPPDQDPFDLDQGRLQPPR